MSALSSWLIVILLIGASVSVLLTRDWRRLILFLSVQYLGMFILTLQHWPLGMATVKIVAGWMSAAILGITRSNLDDMDGPQKYSPLPQGRFFRLIASLVVILIAFTAAPRVDSLMADAGLEVAFGGLLLVGMGLLHLGVTDQILRVTIGLTTVLAGFEIIYAAVESSVLVAALLAIINLGLALAGSYLMIASNAPELEKEPE